MRAVVSTPAGHDAQQKGVAGQRPGDIGVEVTRQGGQNLPPRVGVVAKCCGRRSLDAVRGCARLDEAQPAFRHQAAEELGWAVLSQPGHIQNVDRIGQLLGGDDAGHADLDGLLPVLPPAAVAGDIRVGEVGQQARPISRGGVSTGRGSRPPVASQTVSCSGKPTILGRAGSVRRSSGAGSRTTAGPSGTVVTNRRFRNTARAGPT